MSYKQQFIEFINQHNISSKDVESLLYNGKYELNCYLPFYDESGINLFKNLSEIFNDYNEFIHLFLQEIKQLDEIENMTLQNIEHDEKNFQITFYYDLSDKFYENNLIDCQKICNSNQNNQIDKILRKDEQSVLEIENQVENIGRKFFNI